MTLIKSISGIRGTIGGQSGENLTPIDVVAFASAFGEAILKKKLPLKIVLGRDGRISGPQIEGLVAHTLVMQGFEVVNLGWSTTPTVEMSVKSLGASGGIIVTASHNPNQWNALKFLDENGEFISAKAGESILKLAASGSVQFSTIYNQGKITHMNTAIDDHIDQILEIPHVCSDEAQKRKFKVVVDCINSTGAISIPPLLEKLNCETVLINQDISGHFAHNPEPLEENLLELSAAVIEHQADLGIAVDPDVDRLAFIDEKGKYCGEEYTLVMVADWVLRSTPGNTVSNLSSTKALRDITEKRGGVYYSSAVGEVNVVAKMKEYSAVIGGEGNGGIIYPQLHYGRDALVGIAFLLSVLAKDKVALSEYRNRFPNYVITKNKIDLQPGIRPDDLISALESQFNGHVIDKTDGLKIHFEFGWVHIRKSNTEPIIRLYAEAPDRELALWYTSLVREKLQLTKVKE